MCNFVICKKGKPLISKEERQKMFDANSDGCGLMYSHNGKVHVLKGFMSNDEFEKVIYNLEQRIDLTNETVVLHYRISTTPKVTPSLTHPHIISSVESDFKKLKFSDSIAFVHNGSISNYYNYNKKMSDTQNFSLQMLSKMRKIDSRFYEKKEYLDWIKSLTSSLDDKYNRFCFLDGAGNYYTVGDVLEKDGYIYANENHLSFEAYEDTYYSDKGTIPLMPLNEWSCDIYKNGRTVALRNKYGQDMYFVSDDEDLFDAFAIDKNDNVYRIISELNKYEKLEGFKAIYTDNGELVAKKPSYFFEEQIVIFDVEKLLADSDYSM